EGAIHSIVAEREKSGPFRSVADFCRRVDTQLVNKRALESLVKSGAFDAVGDRATLLTHLEPALRWGAAQREQADMGQMGLFGLEEVRPPALETADPVTPLELLRMEKEALGLYLSSHPMAEYPGLADSASCAVGDLEAWWREQGGGEGAERGRRRVALAGLLQAVVKRPTRKGTMMARFEVADETGAREVVAFSRTYEEIAAHLEADAPAVVVCEVSEEDDALRLVAERLVRWDRRGVDAALPELAVLHFDLDGLGAPQLIELRSLLDAHAGRTPVEIRARSVDGTVHYAPEGVRIDAEAVVELERTCPWLRAAVGVDVRPWLVDRGRPAYGGRPSPERAAAAPSDVPF
ncbi:MAG: DNA polymerase III subunit alpha, partial [Trueperaceae bacterium]|nr:DNA polymerase III subunit alpha [Trueperaceae bacterium]